MKNKNKIFVCLNNRFNPEMIKLKSEHQKSNIKISFIDYKINFSDDLTSTEIDTLILHNIDCIRWILDDKPVQILFGK